jgi:hypothetical protein
VTKDGADQGSATEVPVPVGVEPIPLCPTMLGLHGKGPQDRSGILAQFAQAKAPDLDRGFVRPEFIKWLCPLGTRCCHRR